MSHVPFDVIRDRASDRREFERRAIRPWYAALWLWLKGGAP